MFESNLSAVHCGKNSDNIKTHKQLCENEAKKLVSTLIIEDGDTLEIPFFTNGYPDLICVGYFSKNGAGNIDFRLDYSNCSL